MHQVIGGGQSGGRVRLRDLAGRKEFYGVGALKGLGGEITIADSQFTATAVTPEGRLRDALTDDAEATLLIGLSVRQWHTIPVVTDVPANEFDGFLREQANRLGIPLESPFLFVVEGKFPDTHLHVINGACPVHARLRATPIDEHRRPFEIASLEIRGTMVGIHAVEAAGRLTHPGTTTHRHLLFTQENSNLRVTGHVDDAGLAAGAVLRIGR